MNLPDLPQQSGDTATGWHPPTQLDVVRYLGAYSRALDGATKEAAALGEEYAEARKAHRLAYAHAFLCETGTVKDREQKAILACADEQFRMEVTEQRLKAARERIRTLETQIDTGRSLGAAIRAEMGLAGAVGT